MIDRIVRASIHWRVFVVLATFLLIGFGSYSFLKLPIDAVPDVTTNQVQINTMAPAFAPEEMEKFVTYPMEVAMGSLPDKEEVRSLSKFGLSQVTVTFPDHIDILRARQLVFERLIDAQKNLPPGVQPELAPISTGLGEVFQFTVEAKPGYEEKHSLMELRSILDWNVIPVMRNVPGVIEVNVYGGKQKQYEVLVNPYRLLAFKLSIGDVIAALEKNNTNVGGAYLEKGGEQQLIRGIGLIQSTEDIEDIVIASYQGTPIYVRNIGRVGFGSQVRQGAVTKDGKGETVLGIAMLLKGQNSREVAAAAGARLRDLQKTMPEGVLLRAVYDRGELVQRTVWTASRNLLEGGAIVIAVLFLFLLQLRAGLIVSAASPLAMLAAIIGMRYFNISANLMSLGAIDFGLIVDAAVILVENSVRQLAAFRHRVARPLTSHERIGVIQSAILEVRKSSQFGEMIIIASYLPILTLAGIEGKMFRPMAFTVIFALCGALVLSLTLVPALCAMFLKDREPNVIPGLAKHPEGQDEEVEENPVVRWLGGLYEKTLNWALRLPLVPVAVSVLLFAGAFYAYTRLGAEFVPELDEGSVLVNSIRPPSSSIEQAVLSTTELEKALKSMPEVETIYSRIGRPEIATDPMGPDIGDTYVILKPPDTWPKPKSREELVAEMEERLKRVAGTAFSFSQPIKLRMAELIEGVGTRSDVAVKIFGDDLEVLDRYGKQVAAVLNKISGGADIKVQQLTGLPSLVFEPDRRAIARYGINIANVQEIVQTAIAGTPATQVYEGFKRFTLMVRLEPEFRRNETDLAELRVASPGGQNIPISQLARIKNSEGPAEISRENAERRIGIEANVRGRDLASFVEEAQKAVDQQVKLPPGYRLEWGGTYQNLAEGKRRLAIAVPITFLIIFGLLYVTFGRIRQALLIFTGIPLALTGGVFALVLRDMPFSISAGVGFIAVSGVAVLNGLVLVAFMNQLRQQGRDIETAIREGALTRLRPVLMTAAVASLGFLPMALASGAGAEVQRPLATVVIG
ncbi:MAG: efflux RND transporter permease subunit, partial [Acidobacteriota bacterium]